MGGVVTAHFEEVPGVGQAVALGGLKLTVQAADERRVKELLVEEVKR